MENQPNIPLLRKAVEWVEEQAQIPWQEREWDQRMWVKTQKSPAEFDFPTFEDRLNAEERGVCGTTYCVAGFIAQQAGWIPDLDKTSSTFGMFRKGDTESPASKVAMTELGIYGTPAAELFNANNEVSDIREVAERIAGERL